MKRQSFHRTLSLLLILSMLLGMIPAVFAAGESDSTNYVTNGGFETWSSDSDLSYPPWKIAQGSTTGAASVTGTNIRTGNCGLTFWASSTYSADIYQTTTELSAGTYSLSAYSGGTSGTTAVMYYKVGNDSEQTVSLELNGWGTESPYPLTWKENKAEVTLSEAAKVTVGFRVTDATNASVCVDDVSLTLVSGSGTDPDPETPTGTPDGSFTAGIGTSPVGSTWTVTQSGAKLTAKMTESDGLTLTLPASETAYNTQITQIVTGLDAGATYKFSAKTKLLGGTAPSTAYIFAVDKGGTWQSTGGTFSTASEWTEVSVSAVVAENGSMTVGFYMYGTTSGEYSVAIKDAALTKNTSTGGDTVDKTALTEAITTANSAKEGVATSTDGSDVATGKKWVTEAEMKALTDTITTAQTVANKTDATQDEVAGAVTALSSAVNTFNAAKKDGTKTGTTDPVDPPAASGVQNGGFEDVDWSSSAATPKIWKFDSDTTAGSITAKWKENGVAHGGSYLVAAWAETAFQGGISQEVTGLEPGTYTLSVWAQAGAASAPAVSYIYGHGTGQAKQQTTIDESKNWAWTENKVTGIVVGEDGKATIGYRVEDTAGGYSVNLDDVTLTKSTGTEEPEKPPVSVGALGNGGFETALAPWAASNALATAAWRQDARSGEYALLIGSDSEAVYTRVTQNITGLTPGIYAFSVYSQASDTADSFYIYADGSNGRRTQNIKTGWSWDGNKNTVSNIVVGDDGELTVGIYVNAPVGFWALFDDAALTKVEGSQVVVEAVNGAPPSGLSELGNWGVIKETETAVSVADNILTITSTQNSSGEPVSADIVKTITGLKQGIYTFTVYSRAEQPRTRAAAGASFYISADGDRDGWTKDASQETYWAKNTVSVVNTSSFGTVTLGIHVEAPAGFQAELMNASLTWESLTAQWDIQNGSFESDFLTPWKTTDPDVAFVQDREASGDHDAYDGDKTLTIGSDTKKIEVDVTQTITGLSPGSYLFSIYSQASDTAEEFYIYGVDGERTWRTPEWKIDVKTGWKWSENRLFGIQPDEDGTITIGIHVKASPGFWAIFDEATLDWRPACDIKNPSFERYVGGDPLVDWTATEHIANVSARTPYGGRVVKASSGEDYTADFHQELTGLVNGYYYLTAYTKSTGGQPLSVLYGYGANQSKCMTAIPATEGDGALLPIKEQWVKVVVRGIHVTDGKATIGFETDAKAGQYVLLDDFVLAWDENQDDPYELMKGGDTSCVSYVEDCGGVYYNADGKTAGDLYQLLADNGWNIARLRLYNNPGKGRGSGTYYCLDGYEDLSDILLAAKRAKEKGMQVQLSFHYSDYWSNGSEQYIPAEWMEKIDGKSSEEAVRILEQCVYDYTKDTMLQMQAQGTTPEYVSLGNEMQAGLLYPLGKASTETWPNLARFLNAGYRAVKEVSPDTRVILHLDDAGNEYKYTNFFDNCKKYKVNYDIIGCSYYPFWTKMSVQTIVDFCDMLIERYQKDIIVMETGFGFDDHLPAPNRHQTGQLSHNIPYSDPGHSNYSDYLSVNPNISAAYKGILPSATPEMQREFMIELFNGLKSIGLGTENRCIGDLYWDPILVEQDGVGWAMIESTDLPDRNAVSNTTLFGFDHQLLPVMDAYRNNVEGSTAGAVSGKLKTENGTGIANASLTLHLDKDYTVTTDIYGGFRVANVPAGTYSASISAPGLAVSGGAVSITVTAGETARQDFTADAASLSGIVTDGTGPASGVKVIASAGKTIHQMVTDSDGRYSFPAIAAASYTVTAQKIGYTVAQEKTVNIAQQQIGTADLVMKLTSGTASGKVTAQDGSPLQGVNINAGSGITGTTGADGAYFLSGLTNAQQYTLTFSKAGYASERKVCTGASGVNVELNVMLLEDKGTVTGLLKNNDGEPVVGSTVQCVQNWVPKYAVTDADGRFVLNDLMSGEVLVEISAPDMVSQDVTCDLTPGGTVDVGFITMPEKITLQNPSFDPNVSGWKSGSDRVSDDNKKIVRYQYRNPSSQYDGAYALSFWNSSAFTDDVTQAVELTEPGVYVFRVHSYAGLTYSQFGNSEFYMYVKDGDGEIIARGDIPNSGEFIPNEVVFKVSEAGSYTLGFHANAKGEDWALLDMAELGRLCHPKFTDIDTGAWYHEAADYILNSAVMSGYGNGLFGTNQELSRAQLAQILYNLEGRPEISGGGQFQDVPENAWYYKAVTWAESCGIVTGYGNRVFGANEIVTREQFAIILWNYAKFKGMDIAVIGPVTSDFSDLSDTSEYAIPAVEWAVGSEIISGKDGLLDPKGRVTRAEAAQMLKNFIVKILHK